ncbi:NHLP leader peptide family RiPP precursor, partial [Nitrospinae bacterium AH_259_B05_G02_I21]|nr:NHLP leader peptide family RiPP precursor [Nitrospinae bacterium AH_259_B05_G02_I21]
TTRREVEAEIIRLARTDANFKEKLLSNPKAAIQEVLGQELPKQLNVEVHQEDIYTVHVVIPLESKEYVSDYDEIDPEGWRPF